jgi:hypothetical protein
MVKGVEMDWETKRRLRIPTRAISGEYDLSKNTEDTRKTRIAEQDKSIVAISETSQVCQTRSPEKLISGRAFENNSTWLSSSRRSTSDPNAQRKVLERRLESKVEES